MSQKRIRYSDFVDRLDIDAVEEALEFEVLSTDGNGNDVGHCFDIWGLHSHGDTTGKFAIHREKKVYNCFVCGGGSLLSLVMELKGWDDDEATEWLYQFSIGDTRTDDEFISQFLARFRNEAPQKVVLPYFNTHVLSRFNEETDWFSERGISDTIVDVYRLGYSSKHVRPIPKKDRFLGQDDYVGPAICIPHFFHDRLVGWQNRWLDDRRPKWVAKYTNTYDFPREETLFNYDRAKDSFGPVIVVESAPTSLFLESLGFASVATFGANITYTQGKLLRSFQSGLLLAQDNDKAGDTWTKGLHESLDRYLSVKDIDTSELFNKQGADLGDLAQYDDAKEIIKCLIDDARKPTFGHI